MHGIQQRSPPNGSGKGAISDDGSAYLRLLSGDPEFGATNRYIIDAVVDQIKTHDLAVQLGTLNGLARKARISGAELLRQFRASEVEGKRQGLPPVFAIDAVSGSIGFRIALENHGMDVKYAFNQLHRRRIVSSA